MFTAAQTCLEFVELLLVYSQFQQVSQIYTIDIALVYTSLQSQCHLSISDLASGQRPAMIH